MSTSTLTSKGQTTIPKDIRTRLNLHPGDRLECVIDEDSRVLVLPASLDASELAGRPKPPARPVSVEGMNQAIRKRAGRDNRSRHERPGQTSSAGRSQPISQGHAGDHKAMYV